MSRSHLKTHAIASDIWTALSLPTTALPSLHLPSTDDSTVALPSSFKIGPLAQASIGTSALAAALYRAHRAGLSPESTPNVTVPLHHAAIEFKSERYHWLDDWDANPPQPFLNILGGLHAAAGNGYVRIHDAFPNHVRGTLEILGLPPTATREDIAAKVAVWDAVELETRGTQDGNVAIYALRSYDEWDALPQSSAIANQPIFLRQLTPSSPKHIASPPPNPNQCLSGLRVLELSRVIAAPIAGRTLAAHGADVLWVTSPTLPDLPVLDKDTSRGKRTIQLDLNHPPDKAHLLDLLRTCDVFLQSYRPGSLAAKGLSPEELSKLNPGIICANLSAFGPTGPWSNRRGFDSLVQTCTGMNVSEAQHAGKGEAARAMPCQALDHASGYLLAAGISAALYHRSVSGGSWAVDVSLAGTMKYLRSLGQYEGDSGFAATVVGELKREELPADMVEVRETGFGRMMAVRHAATVEGCEVGYGEMPKPLGSDVAEWK